METSMTSFLLNEEENSLHLKDSSVSVTVPNYPIARLMYYIDCIDSLIDLEIPSKLTDYSNHGRLTTKEENQILVYASLLHPNIFIERGILFENDKYCGDSNNKFYEITAIKKHRVISNNFYIKGKLVRVLNIMAFKKKWLRINYEEPMRSFSARLTALNTSDETTKTTSYSSNYHYDDDDDCCCCCCCPCCDFLLEIPWLFVIGALLIIYSMFGRLIYGGICWGKLKYWNHGNDAARHLWLIELLQWTLALIPGVSFILNCMVIHSTKSSKCDSNYIRFDYEIMKKIRDSYDSFSSYLYFKEICYSPRRYFISFLVCSIIGCCLMVIGCSN